MTDAAFDKIATGLREMKIALAMAQSDAHFDGRPWESLGRRDRDRYLQRSEQALAAALNAALHEDFDALINSRYGTK